MNDDTLPSMTKTFQGMFNYLLMSLNCLFTLALYALLSAYRSSHIEMHSDRSLDTFFGRSPADFFLRREFIAIPILLLAVMFVKEFTNTPYKNRVQLNMFVFATICAHAIFITVVPYIFSLA